MPDIPAALLAQLTRELTEDEDKRPHVYDDAHPNRAPILAHWQGDRLVPSVHADGRRPGKLTVGVGRNLSDRPLSDDEIAYLLANDLRECFLAARRMFPRFDAWTQNRQAAICSLVFNLGETGFSKFVRTVDALRDERWTNAARFLGESLWARQVKARAEKIIRQVREG